MDAIINNNIFYRRAARNVRLRNKKERYAFVHNNNMYLPIQYNNVFIRVVE